MTVVRRKLLQRHGVGGRGALDADVTGAIDHRYAQHTDRLVGAAAHDLDAAGDRLVYTHGLAKVEVSVQEDGSWPRQVFGDASVEDAGGDAALHDQLAEWGTPRQRLVVMHRVAVAGYLGKGMDVLHPGRAASGRHGARFWSAPDHAFLSVGFCVVAHRIGPFPVEFG